MLDDALSWARHLELSGRIPLLIEGDDGTRLDRRAIINALRVGMRHHLLVAGEDLEALLCQLPRPAESIEHGYLSFLSIPLFAAVRPCRTGWLAAQHSMGDSSLMSVALVT